MPTERDANYTPTDFGPLLRFFEELPWAVVSFSFATLMASVACVAVRVAVYALTGS